MTQTASGWLVAIACAGLQPSERERLADAIWVCAPLAIEERDAELVAGFADLAAAEAACAALGPSARCRAVTEDSYLDQWKRFAHPRQIGALTVRLPHHPAPPAGIDVVIDPQRAFGSGAHPSTRLAIELLQSLDLRGARVLDFGCGSGILSIVAARLGAARVVAVDCDPEAQRATLDNARRNGVSAIVEVAGALPAVCESPFDVALANVLLPVHEAMGTAITACCAGTVIASGVLAGQHDRLAAAYRTCTPGAPTGEGEWIALCLERAGLDAHAQNKQRMHI